MADRRSVYKVGGSWMVAVPDRVRRSLGRVRGGEVYWHVTRSGEAVLAKTATRTGGRKREEGAARRMADLERENDELRRQLEGHVQASAHKRANADYLQAIRVGLPIVGTVEETLRLVRDLHARAPYARRGPRSRRTVTVDDVTAHGAADQEPSPSPVPSLVPSEGGDAASGAGSSPPGRPHDH